MYKYSGEIPCEIRPIHWTRCVYCQEQQEQSQKGRLPVRVYVLQVTHCAEHIPAITRSHQLHLGGGMGAHVEIQYLYCTVRHHVKYTGLYNNQ